MSGNWSDEVLWLKLQLEKEPACPGSYSFSQSVNVGCSSSRFVSVITND